MIKRIVSRKKPEESNSMTIIIRGRDEKEAECMTRELKKAIRRMNRQIEKEISFEILTYQGRR